MVLAVWTNLSNFRLPCQIIRSWSSIVIVAMADFSLALVTMCPRPIENCTCTCMTTTTMSSLLSQLSLTPAITAMIATSATQILTNIGNALRLVLSVSENHHVPRLMSFDVSLATEISPTRTVMTITRNRCKLCKRMATQNEKSMYPYVKAKFVLSFVLYSNIFHCFRLWRCKDCGFHVNERNMKGMKHECGTVYCKICGKYETPNHHCFMQPIVEPKHTLQKWCFFDFETRQDHEHGKNAFGPIFDHIPNYCVAQYICEKCKIGWDRNDTCNTCGKHERTFSGDSCRDDFCADLFSEANEGVTAICHNGGRFDTQFLVQVNIYIF